MKVFVNFVLSTSICVVFSAPQYSETNQLEDTNNTEPEAEPQPEVPRHTEVVLTGVNEIPEIETTTYENPKAEATTEAIETTIQPSIITKIYTTLTTPIRKFLQAPKVSLVMTNIGTCIVNGAMEIVSFYFPAPLIPLIASAAGLIIPFEPVVMLREKMPVTSYRRAFKTAVNGFLRTFDRYKYEEDDPYMTGKFYRRFMGDSKEGKYVKGVQDSS